MPLDNTGRRDETRATGPEAPRRILDLPPPAETAQREPSPEQAADQDEALAAGDAARARRAGRFEDLRRELRADGY